MRSLKSLLLNNRFYILATAALSSVGLLALLRLKVPTDQLYYIRSEQLFGLMAAILVYVAILITPLSKLRPKAILTKQVLFARRGIGVAAAYFAALHVFISVQEQLGGLGGVWLLPDRYKLSFGLAVVAFMVLLLMAATSFDKAMQLLTFPRWKRLHRFVYLAGVLIVVHIWLIGTHVEYVSVRYATYLALALLIVLESFRAAGGLRKKWQLERSAYLATALGLVISGLVCLIGLPLIEQNMHAEHTASHAGSDSMMMDGMEMHK